MKYLSFFKLRFAVGLQYRFSAIAGLATQFFWGAMMLFLYEALYKNGISIEGKSNTELISIIDNDPVLPANLSASQVSTSSLSNPLYTARYKVIYEMLLDDPDIHEGVTEQAWNVIYSNNTIVN